MHHGDGEGGTSRLEQKLSKEGEGRNGASSLERWSGREVANCDSCAAEEGAAVDDVMGPWCGSMWKRR
jgi:hypothetical protein